MDKAKWEKAYLHTRRNLKIREKRLKMFELKKGWRVVEFGCGDGLNLKVLRKLGYKDIFGLDNSRELLERIPDIPTILADACNAGLLSDSFDAVLVDSLLHHLAEPDKCLREIKRVLKPSGILCIMEPRNSIARKALDIITFSLFSGFIPRLKSRKMSMQEEYELHMRWLDNEGAFKSSIAKYGFKALFWKKGLIGMFIKCKLIK